MIHNSKTVINTLFNGIATAFLFMGLLGGLTPVYASDELLDVDKAFQLQAPRVEGENVIIQWTIADDYKLYKDKMSATTESIKLGSAIYSKAKFVNDPLFGKTETYAHSASITLPLDKTARPEAITAEILVKYQGCADKVGVCYPPQTRTLSVEIPASKSSNSASKLTSEFSSLSALNTFLTQDSGQTELLDAEEAFQFSHKVNAQGQLELSWTIANDYHLYQDKFKSHVSTGNAQIGALKLPKAETIDDPLFGKTQVFHGTIVATLPILSLPENSTLEIEYQGCSASAGVCYPPIKKSVALTVGSIQPTNTPLDSQNASTDNRNLSESDQIADTLKNNSVWIVMITFFIFGLLLAFTPCVFPMIPILSSIIVGQGKGLTTQRAFIMSLVYVLAMSVTYTLAGVMAGLFGENLQAAFQNPWIIGAFSLIFLLLALSMFGFYELQLPSSLQSKLTHHSNKQQGGTLAGVAIMGFLSALIVGPCVAPPLAGALIYIGQTGDALLGGIALFTMSIGMGLPLLILGTTGGKFLPRAGAWMEHVKAVFGVMLIGIAIWMLERIVPTEVTMLSWATLFIISAVYMGAFDSTAEKSGWFKLLKGVALIFFLYGSLILVGLLGGSKDMFHPLKTFQGTATQSSNSAEHLDFKTIKSIEDLNAELAKGQLVMLDFYADWCISCKEMEMLTLSKPEVQQALKGVTLLQADVTKNDATDKALMKHFGLFGPPAILFFNADGQEQKAQRVIGFQPSDTFINNINQALR